MGKGERITQDQFGELKPYHKSMTKDSWRRNGVNIDQFEMLYKCYLMATNCGKCSKTFNKRSERCLDHNHTTGEFRYFLCRSCNSKYYRSNYISNTSGHRNIVEHDIHGISYYRMSIRHDGEDFVKSFNKQKYSIEDVIEYRDTVRSNFGLD